jgi:predicted small lipoprotein YifL
MDRRLAAIGGPRKLGLRSSAFVPVALAIALAACGRAGELRPPPGGSLPVKPKMAVVTPTPEQLLTPPPIARPVRVDEILRRSEPRRPDRFDLPPPSGAEAAPEPEGDSSATPNNSQTRVQEPQ